MSLLKNCFRNPLPTVIARFVYSKNEICFQKMISSWVYILFFALVGIFSTAIYYICVLKERERIKNQIVPDQTQG